MDRRLARARKVVIGTGITLLYFALESTAFSIGVSVLVVRGLILLGREPRGGLCRWRKGGPRRWMLYLLLLIPLAVVGIWTSVRVSNATELAYFIGFFVFSAAAGLVIGYVRWMSAESSYCLSVLVAEGLRRLSGVPHLVVLDGYAVACIISATAAGPGSRAAPA